MRTIPLKLGPGADLRASLEQVVRDENSEGFVLGVVGNLSRAAFQCPGRAEPTVLEGNLEIITLNGTLSPKGVHLHLSLSDVDCQVWGGHLELGSQVLKAADLLVGFIDEDPRPLQNLNTSDRTKDSRIELVVLPGCPWSSRAVRILRSTDIPHMISIIDSEDKFKEFQSRSELSTFPQIFIDGKLIGGYESLSELHTSGKLTSYK